MCVNIALRRFLHKSWQYRDTRKPTPGLFPTFISNDFKGSIGSTVHSRPLNGLEHCICTTTMTNIRPDRDSNLVTLGYKPQSIRMSHRGRPGSEISSDDSQIIMFTRANTRRWINGGLSLGQRRRLWANIKPPLIQRLVFAVISHAFQLVIVHGRFTVPQ